MNTTTYPIVRRARMDSPSKSRRSAVTVQLRAQAEFVAPTPDAIRMRALAIFEERTRVGEDGNAVDDWCTAERQTWANARQWLARERLYRIAALTGRPR